MALRVGAQTITVVPLLDEEEVFGEWDWMKGEIRLLPGLKGPVYGLTLLHEVLHAISDLYGLDLEEGHVRTLEQAVGAFIRDNAVEARRIIDSITGETQNG